MKIYFRHDKNSVVVGDNGCFESHFAILSETLRTRKLNDARFSCPVDTLEEVVKYFLILDIKRMIRW